MALPLPDRLRVSRDRLQCGATRVTRFMADEIDGPLPSVLAEHTNGCARCRADARRSRLLAHGLAVLRQEQVRAPVGFLTAVSANLHQAGRRSRSALGSAPTIAPKRSLGTLTAGASVVAATGITVAVVRRLRGDF